jgi:hypothetical protein
MGKGVFGRIGLVGVIGCVAIGAMVLAGCGGGSDTTSAGASGASGASGTALSQDEFVSQANAICADSHTQVEALKAPSANSTLADQLPTLEKNISIANDTYAKMSALTPPSDLQAQFAQYLSGAKAQIGLAQDVVIAVNKQDEAKVQSLASQINAGVGKSHAQAESLGLTECAKDARPQG